MIYTEDLVKAIYDDICVGRYHPFKPSNTTFGYLMPATQQEKAPEYQKIKNNFELEFIWDIGYKIYLDKPVSSKQYQLLVRVLRGYKHLYISLGLNENDIESWFKQDVTRLAVYTSKEVKKEVRYIGDNFISFRFLYNKKIIDIFKILKDVPSYYDYDNNIYTLECNNTYVLNKVYYVISEFGFSYDEQLENYLLSVENIKKSLTIDDNKIILKKSSILENWITQQIQIGK